MIPVCASCGIPTIEPFAIRVGSDGEAFAGIIIRRPVRDVVWCSCPCWIRNAGSGLTSERSPNQMELVI